ncbi:hypothetical protein BGX23_004885 [Mortierella sp. AD031]|nr:hypothetical protein BGX23_004885 [Mortierella sp. AD031]
MHTALDIPEIVARIGEFIPLWQQDAYSHFHFRPKFLLDAAAVSRSFRQALLPVLWYTCDMSPLESQVPLEVLLENSYHFRILYQILPLAPNPLPCTRLLDLTVSGCDPEVHQLVRNNTLLRRLHWSGPTAYSLGDIPVLEGDMVEGLTALESLHLSEWDLGHERALIPMLMFLLDLVCLCPELEKLTLIAACEADIGLLSDNLKKYCPRLHTLKIDGVYFGLFDTYRILKDRQLAALILCTLRDDKCKQRRRIWDKLNDARQWEDDSSNSYGLDEPQQQGLVYFTGDIHGFEPMFTEALIQCGGTLKSLRLSIRHDPFDHDDATMERRTDLVRDQAQLSRVLKACPYLERVTLLYEDTILPDPGMFGVKGAGVRAGGQDGPVVTVNVTESEFVPHLH